MVLALGYHLPLTDNKMIERRGRAITGEMLNFLFQMLQTLVAEMNDDFKEYMKMRIKNKKDYLEDEGLEKDQI